MKEIDGATKSPMKKQSDKKKKEVNFQKTAGIAF